METVTLTPSEIHFAKQLAKKRIKHNEKSGTCNTPYGGKTLEQVMTEGVCGEIGFCKLHNIFPSLTFDNYDEAGYDAYLHGRKIEIKTNDKGKMFVKDLPKLDKREADYFALMDSTDFPTMGFAGFISASSLLNRWHYNSSKYLFHPCYIAYTNELITELPKQEGWSFENYTRTEGQIPTENIWDYSSPI